MAVTQTIRNCLLAALVTVAPLSALAQEEDPFDGRLLPLELIMAHRGTIGLTAEQNTRIGELVVEVQQAVAGRRWEMQTAYFELMEVLDEPEVDEARALALAEKAVDTENEIKLEQLRLLIRLRNLLTPEQVATLRALREQAANARG